MAYARIIFPDFRYQEPSIGRVLTTPAARGLGLGRQLMEQCIAKCETEYPDQNIRIMAQAYLKQFYTSLGFEPIGLPYDEDGIEHIDMVRFSSGKVAPYQPSKSS